MLTGPAEAQPAGGDVEDLAAQLSPAFRHGDLREQRQANGGAPFGAT